MSDGALPVCVAFVVSEEGAVRSEQLLAGVPDCVDADRPGITPFVDAALAAVAQWQLFAAGLCTWQQEEAECTDGRAAVSPLAIRLPYRLSSAATAGSTPARADCRRRLADPAGCAAD